MRRVRRDGEAGGVLVLVAITIPVLVILTSFVLDVGDWYEHKRHLQLQADAAALAGGGAFVPLQCSSNAGAENSAIATEARKYGGPAATGGGVYNPQVGNTASANLHILINSTEFWNKGGSDNTLGTPCSTGFVDVKATESDAPWFLKVGGLVGIANPTINAHARVQLLEEQSGGGFLPIALPVADPKAGQVTFINENTGGVIATAPLARNGAANGLALWDNSASPIGLTIPTDAGGNTVNIGVRIALSGNASSTTCGDNLVQCYTGIDYVRGYSASGSGAQPNAPILRSAQLIPNTCSDGWFSATTCTDDISATVDMGGLASPGTNAHVYIVNGNQKIQLQYVPGANPPSTARWVSTGGKITVTAGAKQVPVTLGWEETTGTVGANGCNTRGNNPCTGTFSGFAQRSYGALNDITGSGPIQTMTITAGGAFSTHTYQQGSTVSNVVVQIGIQDVLELAKASDPPVQLRVVVGSQNQSVDCDPNISTLKEELHLGCAPIYGRNSGSDPCGTSAPALWGTPQPWLCVATQTGGATNQVPAGLNERILGTDKPSTCPAAGQPGHNNWPNYQANDPRVVQVFVTPFGSFDGQGTTTVPVTRFAAFYITGWTGQGSGFNNPCQGNGDDPAPDSATIVGHFIKYVDTASDGQTGGACDLTSIDSCALVMVQ